MRRNLVKALGAFALGLPAAVLAHALAFGGGHAIGGNLHALVLDLVAVCCAAAGGALFAVSCLSAGATPQGTLAAMRLRASLPSAPWLFAGACVWFAAIEFGEAHHSIALVQTAISLAAASWLIRSVFRAIARVLACVVWAAASVARSQTAPWVAFFFAPAAPRRPALTHRFRLFSRPPPAFA